ncbi:hypothetical protein P8452_78102 [Trifolium repens]|nr:hypothetical protein P8452_78102 [Trifolium repens]
MVKLINSEDVVANEINRKLLDSINGWGYVYMTHAMVEGVFVIIRCAIGATLTVEMHTVKAWKVVQQLIRKYIGNFLTSKVLYFQ